MLKRLLTQVRIAKGESEVGHKIKVTKNGDKLIKDTILFNIRVGDVRSVRRRLKDNWLLVSINDGGTTSGCWKRGDHVFIIFPRMKGL